MPGRVRAVGNVAVAVSATDPAAEVNWQTPAPNGVGFLQKVKITNRGGADVFYRVNAIADATNGIRVPMGESSEFEGSVYRVSLFAVGSEATDVECWF